jgi:hypothetical protein
MLFKEAALQLFGPLQCHTKKATAVKEKEREKKGREKKRGGECMV